MIQYPKLVFCLFNWLKAISFRWMSEKIPYYYIHLAVYLTLHRQYCIIYWLGHVGTLFYVFVRHLFVRVFTSAYFVFKSQVCIKNDNCVIASVYECASMCVFACLHLVRYFCISMCYSMFAKLVTPRIWTISQLSVTCRKGSECWLE